MHMIKEKDLSLSSYLEDLQSRGRYWFLKKQAQKALNLSDNAFKKAAHRLILKNKLNRIKSNFYTLVPPEYRATGSLPASWFIDALMEYLNQQYYVGILTAAALHGAAHQQPMVFQVVTDKQMRSITVGQVRIQFLYKKIIEPHFFQQMKTPTGIISVSTPEMTAFDLVRYINAAGQVNNVATILSEMTNLLNPVMLGNLLKKNDVEVSVAQRLGYLLNNLGLDINLSFLENQIKKKKPSRRLLVMGSNSPILEYNRRWQILVNESVEADDI